MIVGSPAHESGLKVGDVLVEADGMKLTDVAEALRALTTPDEPGSVMPLPQRQTSDMLMIGVLCEVKGGFSD